MSKVDLNKFPFWNLITPTELALWTLHGNNKARKHSVRYIVNSGYYIIKFRKLYFSEIDWIP